MGVAFLLYLIILITHRGVLTTSNPIVARSDKFWGEYVTVNPEAALPNRDRKTNLGERRLCP